MNNDNQTLNWRCPNCDTINQGSRCIICGELKAKTPIPQQSETFVHNEENRNFNETDANRRAMTSKPKKSGKGAIIALSVIGGILLIALIVIIVVAFGGSDDKKETDKKPTPAVTHEIDDEEIETKPKERYVTDAVFGVNFNISADSHKMDASPAYTEKEQDVMKYIYPTGFKEIGLNKYMASDGTALLYYSVSENNDRKTVEALMEECKNKFGGDYVYEANGDSWFAVSRMRNGVNYYRKCFVGEKTAWFDIVYPDIYSDIYENYVTELERYFKADVGELETEDEKPDTESIDIDF